MVGSPGDRRLDSLIRDMLSHSHFTKVTFICIYMLLGGCSFTVMVCAVDCRRLGTQHQHESPTLHATTRSVEMGPRATIANISGCQFGSLATHPRSQRPLLVCSNHRPCLDYKFLQSGHCSTFCLYLINFVRSWTN